LGGAKATSDFAATLPLPEPVSDDVADDLEHAVAIRATDNTKVRIMRGWQSTERATSKPAYSQRHRANRPINSTRHRMHDRGSRAARSIRQTDVMEPFPRIKAYYERCHARPAWQRTLGLYAERLAVNVDDIR